MLCQYHHAEPYPHGVETHQGGQALLTTGPYQGYGSGQAGEIQLPYLDAEYQAGDDDGALGPPCDRFHCVEVGPVVPATPHAIAVDDLAPTYPAVQAYHYGHGHAHGEQYLCQVHMGSYWQWQCAGCVVVQWRQDPIPSRFTDPVHAT